MVFGKAHLSAFFIFCAFQFNLKAPLTCSFEFLCIRGLAFGKNYIENIKNKTDAIIVAHLFY